MSDDLTGALDEAHEALDHLMGRLTDRLLDQINALPDEDRERAMRVLREHEGKGFDAAIAALVREFPADDPA